MKRIILLAIICLLLLAGFSQTQCPSYLRVINVPCGGGVGIAQVRLYFNTGCPSMPYPLIDSVYNRGQKLDVDFLTPDGSNCQMHNYISYCITNGDIPTSQISTFYLSFAGQSGEGKIVCLVSAEGPLPVVVTGVWTDRYSNHVVTRWETAQEIDILNFQLQRSFDNVNYQDLATFPSRGKGTATTTYTYTDDNNYSKVLSFYRIRINDINGGFTYTFIKDVSGLRIGEEVELYPNPAPRSAMIHLSQSYAQGTVEIRDNAGRLMQTEILQNSGSFQLHHLNNGMYIVKIRDKATNEVLVKKIIVTD